MDFIMSSEPINKIIAYCWAYVIPYSIAYIGGMGGGTNWSVSALETFQQWMSMYVCLAFHFVSTVQSVLEAAHEECAWLSLRNNLLLPPTVNDIDKNWAIVIHFKQQQTLHLDLMAVPSTWVVNLHPRGREMLPEIRSLGLEGSEKAMDDPGGEAYVLPLIDVFL